MGVARSPESVWLFLAVTHQPQRSSGEALAALSGSWGVPSSSFGPFPFDHTGYYRDEMGPGLIKSYHLYDRPCDRACLVEWKINSNAIEARLAVDGRRTVNLDPGYLARDKLVLASTKDYFHRLYLGRGIYAEVTLHFRQGQWRHFSWTYADYREPAFLAWLQKQRAGFVGELRNGAQETIVSGEPDR